MNIGNSKMMYIRKIVVAIILGFLANLANAQTGIGITINEETFPYNATNLSRIYEAIIKNPDKIGSSSLKAVADSYFTGQMYFSWLQLDETCEKNMDKAFKLYSLLSCGNYDPKDMYHAQMRLGTMYIEGLGVAKDTKKGFAKYMGAATEGNTIAQIFVARSYLTGEYSNQDYKQANFWFSKASEPTDGNRDSSRNGYACYMLGCAYYDGNALVNGIVDYEKAVEYLRVNLRFLQRHYGDIVENGDEEEKRNLSDVCNKLQTCYRFGRGIVKDEEWADVLLKMAAELGDYKAKTLVEFQNEKPTLY